MCPELRPNLNRDAMIRSRISIYWRNRWVHLKLQTFWKINSNFDFSIPLVLHAIHFSLLNSLYFCWFYFVLNLHIFHDKNQKNTNVYGCFFYNQIVSIEMAFLFLCTNCERPCPSNEKWYAIWFSRNSLVVWLLFTLWSRIGYTGNEWIFSCHY